MRDPSLVFLTFTVLWLAAPAFGTTQSPLFDSQTNCQEKEGAIWGKPSDCLPPDQKSSQDPLGIALVPIDGPADLGSSGEISPSISLIEIPSIAPSVSAQSRLPPPPPRCTAGNSNMTEIQGGMPLQGTYFNFYCETVNGYINQMRLVSTSAKDAVLDAMFISCNDGSGTQLYGATYNANTDVEIDTPAGSMLNSVTIFTAPGYPITGILLGTPNGTSILAGGSNSPNGTAPMDTVSFSSIPADSRLIGVQGSYDIYFNSMAFFYTCT